MEKCAIQAVTSGPVYVMYEVQDLDRIQSFMTDFGLVVAKRTDSDLWMAAVNEYPFAYHATRGNSNRFIGAGFEMPDLNALMKLAEIDGNRAAIEDLPGPGGGIRLQMRMPDGFLIDAVCNLVKGTNSEDCPIQEPLNTLHHKARFNKSVRVLRGPRPVRRLGHFVLHVSDHDGSVKWLKDRLGLIPSDYFGTDEETPQIFGTFLRVDAADNFVDHHCMLVLQSKNIDVHHISFEMTGLDDVMCAHDHLVSRGYNLDVGVGRHMLGSQIFDYWRDPFGFRVEHYTDGDVVNCDYVPTIFSGSAEETTQWGATPNAEFFE